MSDFYVTVRKRPKGGQVKRLGPMTENKAKKVCRGININLDTLRFYTEITQESENEE